MNLHLLEGSWSDGSHVIIAQGPWAHLPFKLPPWAVSMISIHPGPNAHSINHTQSLLDPTLRHNVHTPTIPQAHASIPPSVPEGKATFDSILAASKLPPPGPDHYAARRALWLTPRCPAAPRSPEPSTSRKRLERVLSSPNAVESNAAWKNGIEDVWKGLSSGGRLKRRLPMSLIVCSIITHCPRAILTSLHQD